MRLAPYGVRQSHEFKQGIPTNTNEATKEEE